MKLIVQTGITDYTTLVKIRDTTGAAKTGLTEASIDIAYARVETDNDVTTTDVTPAALSALTDAHTDWGFEEVSATDHPGLYRLDIADAVFATGAWSAVVTVVGSGLDSADLEFQLVPWNPLDTVRLGLTALPNAAADAAGGLVISDAGGLDADAQRADVAAILVDTGTTLDGRLPAALVGGAMNSSVSAMTAPALKDFFDTDSTTTYGAAVAGSVVAEIADNAGGSSLTEAGIADAVWDEAIAGHVGAGSTGAALDSSGGGDSDPFVDVIP